MSNDTAPAEAVIGITNVADVIDSDKSFTKVEIAECMLQQLRLEPKHNDAGLRIGEMENEAAEKIVLKPEQLQSKIIAASTTPAPIPSQRVMPVPIGPAPSKDDVAGMKREIYSYLAQLEDTDPREWHKPAKIAQYVFRDKKCVAKDVNSKLYSMKDDDKHLRVEYEDAARHTGPTWWVVK